MARDQLVVGDSLQSCRQQGSIPWWASMEPSPSPAYGAALLTRFGETRRKFKSCRLRSGGVSRVGLPAAVPKTVRGEEPRVGSSPTPSAECLYSTGQEAALIRQ